MGCTLLSILHESRRKVKSKIFISENKVLKKNPNISRFISENRRAAFSFDTLLNF